MGTHYFVASSTASFSPHSSSSNMCWVLHRYFVPTTSTVTISFEIITDSAMHYIISPVMMVYCMAALYQVAKADVIVVRLFSHEVLNRSSAHALALGLSMVRTKSDDWQTVLISHTFNRLNALLTSSTPTCF